jgi:hypothetical protein
VFETDFHDAAGSSFAVSPDGRRILVNKPVDLSPWDETPVTLVSWAPRNPENPDERLLSPKFVVVGASESSYPFWWGTATKRQ